MVENCIFCRIVNHEIPAKIIYEDDQVVAFHDISPKAPVHVLIIPKKHIPTLAHLQEEDLPLIAHIHKVVLQLQQELGLQDGFRLIANCDKGGGQEVFHLHYHMLGGGKIEAFPE